MYLEQQCRPVLVTGATGYIGGRLVPRLLEAGYRVRCLVRSPRKLADRPWAGDPRVEIVGCDLLDGERLVEAMRGCGAAYYLIHSMDSAGPDYARQDRVIARTFADAAERAGLERIVYLGGLGETGKDLSEHLSSRREVGRILASRRTPVTVLRAAMIIGSGSASFEILRYLVERLPVMVTPRWVRTECQPIAVADVLGYLVDCLSVPATAGRTLDIGGPDILSYLDLMRVMADARGLRRRLVVPVPVLTPRLSALWIHLVTPVGRRIARPLAEGLRNRVVCRSDTARHLMPRPLLSAREAIDAALESVDHRDVETVWSTAGAMPGDPDWSGGACFTHRQATPVDAPAAAVFRAVCRLGGAHGWYAADWLWRVRGLVDRLAGGPGLRRGRRDPERLAVGEALDFWRVVDVRRDRRVALRADMKLPGEAALEFLVEPEDDHRRSRLVQVARFRPRGLAGLAYWYAVLPLHALVFRAMLRGLRREAEASARPTGSRRSMARPPRSPPTHREQQALKEGERIRRTARNVDVDR